MRDAVLGEMPGQEVFIAAAAVADYRPAAPQARKIKRSAESMTLELTPNTDIVAEVAALPARPFVVGFAAETNDVEKHARAKLTRKGCDWIVANDVTQPGVMGGAENAVMIVSKAGVERWDRAGKDEVAMKIAQKIAQDLA